MSQVTDNVDFTLPYIGYKLHLPLSPERIASMKATIQSVPASHAADVQAMHTTMRKLIPIALGLISAIVLSPIWMPIAMLSSFLLGPVTWILAGVSGCVVRDCAQAVFQSFEEQCPVVRDYMAACFVMGQRGITDESQSIQAPSHQWFSFSRLFRLTPA